jgi:hypothetical protein
MPLTPEKIRYFKKHFLTYKQLDTLKPPEWLIYNRIPTRGISFLIGKDGVCKTTTAVSMACAIASGIDWAGLPTRHGKVIYIAAEDANGTGPKFRAWCKHHNIADMPDFLLFNDSISLDAYNETLDMIEYITHEYGKSDIKLVIVDTLALCTSGVNENSKSDMDEVIRSIYRLWKAFSCSVLVIHHTGVGSERLRGSTSMDGVSSATLRVEHIDDRVGISDAKRRYGPPQQTLYLDKVIEEIDGLDEAGLQKTQLVLTKAQNQIQHIPGILTKRQKEALLLIYEAQDHSMQQSGLQAAMSISKQNASSNIVSPLRAKDFITILSDGAINILTVTRKGERYLVDQGVIENPYEAFDLEALNSELGLIP